MKDIIFDPPTPFFFKSGDYIPFKDREVCERVRKLTREQAEKRMHGSKVGLRVWMKADAKRGAVTDKGCSNFFKDNALPSTGA